MFNDSYVDKLKDGLVINGIVEYEDESVFEDDDEGLIIWLRKCWWSNMFFDSGLDKIEEKVMDEVGVLKNEDKMNKELVGFDIIISGKLNSVEGESGIIKKKMKLNDEELSVEVSDDLVDNLDFEDFFFLLLLLFLFLFEDSDNGEFMDYIEDNFLRENEDICKCFEDGLSEFLFEINNFLVGVYLGFGS